MPATHTPPTDIASILVFNDDVDLEALLVWAQWAQDQLSAVTGTSTYSPTTFAPPSTAALLDAHFDEATGLLYFLVNTSTGTAWIDVTGQSLNLAGLTLADGSVPFTGAVGGVAPTSAAHLTPKGYVDAKVPAQTVSSAAPVVTASTKVIDFHYRPDTSKLYIYINNGTSNVWLQIN